MTKLFHIVEPTTAYFGQKDACQCAVIRRLVQDLDLDVDVQVLDTIREVDGLALSSRNAYLTPAERSAAPVVYRALCAARELWQQQQQQPTPILLLRADELRAKVQQVLAQEPLIVEVLYVAVDCRDTMRPLDTLVPGKDAIVSVACKLGGVRLIDNIVLS